MHFHFCYEMFRLCDNYFVDATNLSVVVTKPFIAFTNGFRMDNWFRTDYAAFVGPHGKATYLIFKDEIWYPIIVYEICKYNLANTGGCYKVILCIICSINFELFEHKLNYIYISINNIHVWRNNEIGLNTFNRNLVFIYFWINLVSYPHYKYYINDICISNIICSIMWPSQREVMATERYLVWTKFELNPHYRAEVVRI